MKKIKI